MTSTKLIHGIDPEVWNKFKARCISKKLKIGQALTDILAEHLSR